jgi:hypothetical protein
MIDLVVRITLTAALSAAIGACLGHPIKGCIIGTCLWLYIRGLISEE